MGPESEKDLTDEQGKVSERMRGTLPGQAGLLRKMHGTYRAPWEDMGTWALVPVDQGARGGGSEVSEKKRERPRATDEGKRWREKSNSRRHRKN